MNVYKQTQKVGLIFGKFYPLHRGHLFLIEKAAAQVDELHVMLGCEESRDLALFQKSHLPKQPSAQDRLAWLKTSFKGRKNIHIHLLDEAGIAFYPNGWQDWSDRVKSILSSQGITPTTIFTSELQDKELHQHHFGCDVILVDVDREYVPISATEIRNAPFKYWDFLTIPAKQFFSLNFGWIQFNEMDRILAQQLANIYQTKIIDYTALNQQPSSQPFQFTLIPQQQQAHCDKIDNLHLITIDGRSPIQRLEYALKTIQEQLYHHG